MLLEVNPSQPDLIAKEICYHKSCYSKYTNQKTLDALSGANVTEESVGVCGSAYTRAFSQLASDIHQSILSNPDEGNVASMPDLCSRYVLLLEEEGVSLDKYRTDQLKHRLQTHFQYSLTFFRSSKQVTDPEMVAATAMPQSLLLEHAANNLRSVLAPNSDVFDDGCGTHSTYMDLGDLPLRTYEVLDGVAGIDLYYSALHLRQQVLTKNNTLPAEPTLDNLSKSGPESVPVNFLSCVLCGYLDDQGGISLERKVDASGAEADRHITSVAQDIVHLATRGRVRTPKHFILPMTVRHLTRS